MATRLALNVSALEGLVVRQSSWQKYRNSLTTFHSRIYSVAYVLVTLKSNILLVTLKSNALLLLPYVSVTHIETEYQ
jgi:hypothetical protein